MAFVSRWIPGYRDQSEKSTRGSRIYRPLSMLLSFISAPLHPHANPRAHRSRAVALPLHKRTALPQPRTSRGCSLRRRLHLATPRSALSGLPRPLPRHLRWLMGLNVCYTCVGPGYTHGGTCFFRFHLDTTARGDTIARLAHPSLDSQAGYYTVYTPRHDSQGGRPPLVASRAVCFGEHPREPGYRPTPSSNGAW